MAKASNLIPHYLGSFASDAAVNSFLSGQGFYPQSGAAAPTFQAIEGCVYLNNATSLFRMWNGSSWQELTGGGSSDNSNVGPNENITSSTGAGTDADRDFYVHLITTAGNAGISRVNLADGTTDGERHRFTVEALGDNSDQLDVYMTLTGAYDRIRFDNPADVFDGFEVVWDGSNWWPMWRESCDPYFSPA